MKKITTFIRAHKFLLCMMLLFVLVREGMVIFDMWSTEYGGDLPEILISGNLAFDVLDGTWRGRNAYFYSDRGQLGNEVMYGIVAIPLYLLFGNSLFVLCQVQILSSLAILSLMYVFCKKYFGHKVANIAAWLFVCLPMGVQGWLIYPCYMYFDNILYTLTAFMLFIKIIEGGYSRKTLLYSGLLGLVSGIGIFQTEIYLLTVGCVLVFWLLYDRLFFRKHNFFLFLSGLIVGLIPSFCLGQESYRQFVDEFFARELICSDSLWTPLRLMAPGFYPIQNLSFSTISAPIVAIIGLAVLLITVFWVKVQKKSRLPFYLIAFYAFSFLLIAFFYRAAAGHYLYPSLVPIIILLSICIHNVQARWFNKTYLKSGFYAVLFFVCFINICEITQHFDLRNIAPRLQKQLSINGCCFYWPQPYIPPREPRTEVGNIVTAVAVNTAFIEEPMSEPIPRKVIYVSDTRIGEFLLVSPQSYVIYGEDVSFAGLEQLSKEIRQRAPEAAKSYAYMGLAVYYVNDNWLKDLLRDFKAGVIEENIPQEFQHYFYEELARKTFVRYYRRPEKIDKALNMFNNQQKRWMVSIKLTAP